ncbi:hypothetical protein KY290_030962 [Solanum tuberosum]|uniref:Uncharacterized protein n=1 Tax=Solanum tuberosum TaxID=4113 RepID=A0ABQ7U9P8_SOLTU|nr:hypothetical protein KY285_030047 [Solanum tuberosum]KAH0742969.1 hypothetical protein KY290_030962 [Solanum tuberosum]
MLVNKAQTCAVILQWRNRCLLVSRSSMHREHLVYNAVEKQVLVGLQSLFAQKTPRGCVGTPPLQCLMSQTGSSGYQPSEAFSLWLEPLFQISFHGPVVLHALPNTPQIYYLFTVNSPSLWCPHTNLSGSRLVSGNPPFCFNNFPPPQQFPNHLAVF